MPNPTPITKKNLDAAKDRALRQAARTAEKWREAEDAKNGMIQMCAELGASLREISDATGIPHMTVKRIIDRS